MEAKPLTANRNGQESSRATDPRAGSKARRCGARFGNGVGEGDPTPMAVTGSETSGAWTGAAAQTDEKPAEARTSWTRLETVSMRSANRANWHKAALSECKSLALDKGAPQNRTAERCNKAQAITTEDCKCTGNSGQPTQPQSRGAERPSPAVGAQEVKPRRRATSNNKRKTRLSGGRCGCACLLSRTVVIRVEACERNHLHLMVSKK